MAVPQDKTALLQAIDKNFEKLMGYLRFIPPEYAKDKNLSGHAKGSMMSIHDLVAYLSGWNALVIKWLTQDATGKEIHFPETGYKWNQLGKLAQKFYQDYDDWEYTALIDYLSSLKSQIVEKIESYDNEKLYRAAWYGKWTMGRMISFNTSSPYANACGRLRKWAKEKHYTFPK
ncbi:ClbS/DfsB family four-helix bundle protein [Zymomonas sp.]|uniref:ClbS/DfsB family four-helix bundle protein n=1 Tax=Zymomonas sp. TaxID=2068624 RepID=UPI0025DBFF4F|nr:ClbS/DfsB family four-helix bundle protein [Zymomonas sp.]MCA1955407.1 ClbS/DfsB family four-helix bundle protein [Zymomonas sp.]